jgi:hypothetical protein
MFVCSSFNDAFSVTKTSAIFLYKKVSKSKEWPKIRLKRGGVSYTNAKEKVPKRRSGVASFLERTSGTAL